VTRELIANVINTVAQILYVLILARIVVSWIGLNPWNPIVRWLRIIVDPILRPFRRVLPTFGGIDFSPLLAILVIFFIARLATSLILSGGANVTANTVVLIRDVLLNIIIVLGVLVLIRLLLSVFNADPWHPLVAGVRSMTNLLVAPFAGIGRRGHMRSMYTHQRAIDVPAVLALGLYVVLYFVVLNIFNRLVLPAVL
jgi:YggT family protein